MKAIKLNAVIKGLSARVDRSLSLNVSTPELTSEEKAELMNLQSVNIELYIKPLEEAPDAVITIDKELNQKTPSQRLRNVLYVLHQQQGIKDDFDIFYKHNMNSIIEKLKDKLE